MKIADFRIYPVATPPPHLGGECWLFVVLQTDGGVRGAGEIYSVPFRPQTAAAMAADVCERCVVGADPFRIEKLWREIYSGSYTQRPDPSLLPILSGVEMACWDIIGKELNKPAHALLGGMVREKLRTYTYLYPEKGDSADVYICPKTAAKRAAEYAAEGFTAVKFDPAGIYTAYDPRQLRLENLTRSEDFVREIRAAVGDSCDLLFGTHGQMTPAGAIRLAKRLEFASPLWLEEPVPPENPAAMAKVARATSIPVAAGERLTTKYEFAQLLAADGAAILQPNLAKCGGLLEGKKIAAIAETYQAQIAPHLYCGPIAAAANIQLAACIPNFLILEGIKKWDGFTSAILEKPFLWEGGYLAVPDA
ncbi:MAG: mandelate racemase/muconate lactonizing enzyme family protein, partial [Betaproteobacteria bacterium]|nr:mandelate racemase/muconate lactonizing enzyme family protein [Betaproteobacteria bacterium]